MRSEQRAEGVKRVRSCVPETLFIQLCNLFMQKLPSSWVLSKVGLQAMEEFVAEIDHNELRPLQKQGFLCGANCCDTARTQEDLQRW